MGRPALCRYRIVDRIGAGGMGVVYRAEDNTLGRQVALKFFPRAFADRVDLVSRFQREARAAAALSHPAICTVYDVSPGSTREAPLLEDGAPDELTGSPFIAMELVRGRSLKEVLGGRPLPLREALRIGSEIADGLTHAHRAGIVHRDLKPGNVMITPEGRVKILDFGLAKFVGPGADGSSLTHPSVVDTLSTELTRTGEVLGTSAYMSPEQARGLDIDPRSDVFSFGSLLHEMATGRPAFTGPTRPDIVGALLRDQPPPPSRSNPEVPLELDRIVGKCLEKDPANRYQHTDDLAVDLRKLMGGTESASHPARVEAPRRRRWVASFALVVTAAIAVTALIFLRPFAPSMPAEPIKVAVLPFAYEGPPEKAYLKDVVPLAIAERMRSMPRLQVASFASSRTFGGGVDPNVVMKQLGVTGVVAGALSVTEPTFRVTVRVAKGGGALRDLPGKIEGNLGEMVALSAGSVSAITAELGGGDTGSGDPAHRDPVAMEAYLRGVTLLEGWDIQRNAVEAEKSFREAIAAEPGFAEAQAKLAITLVTESFRTRDVSRIAEADTIARGAASLSPNLPETQEAIGLVHLAQGRSAEAAAAFQRAAAMAPADDALLSDIARSYAKLGRDEEAEAMYRRAVDLRPSFWGGYNLWGGFCFMRGRLGKAEELYRKVIALRPESDLGYSNLAAVLIQSGKHAEAEPILHAALQINPGVQTHNNLGVVYYALGRFEEAAKEWTAAAAQAEDAMVYSNLGDARRQMKSEAPATEAYRRSIEISRARLAVTPSDSETRAMMSNALAGSGRCEEARAEASRAADDGGSNPSVAYYAALASAICGQRPEAVHYVLLAIKGGIVADVQTNPDLKPLLGDDAVRDAIQRTVGH